MVSWQLNKKKTTFFPIGKWLLLFFFFLFLFIIKASRIFFKKKKKSMAYKKYNFKLLYR